MQQEFAYRRDFATYTYNENQLDSNYETNIYSNNSKQTLLCLNYLESFSEFLTISIMKVFRHIDESSLTSNYLGRTISDL